VSEPEYEWLRPPGLADADVGTVLTCDLCGQGVGDPLQHTAWHAETNAIVTALTEAIVALQQRTLFR
jgi:hypothetical protein